MNDVIQTVLRRKSVRAYEDKPIEPEIKEQILHAAMRSPTAGNMMLYSIIEVNDQSKKDRLAETCDHQPFIAKAPLVLLFVADYQRWYDYFLQCGVKELCNNKGVLMRQPAEGDLLLACCDALIAAQTAVIVAESLSIGSCYIGDIMENWEAHREMFDLPLYTFPVCLVCFGYPAQSQQARKLTERFAEKYIVFQDTYKRLLPEEYVNMFFAEEQSFKQSGGAPGAVNVGQWFYQKKFNADFSIEMTRSVRAWIKRWSTG